MDIQWAEIITELEGRGWSIKGIAAEVGGTSGGISDIKNGRTKQPVGVVAVRLFELHRSDRGPVDMCQARGCEARV